MNSLHSNESEISSLIAYARPGPYDLHVIRVDSFVNRVSELPSEFSFCLKCTPLRRRMSFTEILSTLKVNVNNTLLDSLVYIYKSH